jgi:predicted DNA-binding helix-hairpin-helix protein
MVSTATFISRYFLAALSHVDEAMELADRVSINMEEPSASRPEEICPTKDFINDIHLRQKYIRNRMDKTYLPACQTTQLVVGAAGESDEEILKRILREYEELMDKRTYYSAFSPQKT